MDLLTIMHHENVNVTSEPTEVEAKIAEQFEFNEIRGKNTQSVMLAGFVVRSSIDIACYNRSMTVHPDKKAHYQRLMRCSERFAKGMVHHYETWSQSGPSHVRGARDIIDEIDWSETEIMPIIHIENGVAYGGTESSYLTFERVHELSETRKDLIA